jgi:phenylpropionate dioxygenase-like ring-hydroxylating dioxygenase large terminal subunit
MTRPTASSAAAATSSPTRAVRAGDEAHLRSNWVYLAHESQIPEINDYFTTTIGRQPIVITRQGRRAARRDQCLRTGRHAVPQKHGNKGSFTCPFHGWTFNNTGKLLKVKDEKTTEYRCSSTTARTT